MIVMAVFPVPKDTTVQKALTNPSNVRLLLTTLTNIPLPVRPASSVSRTLTMTNMDNQLVSLAVLLPFLERERKLVTVKVNTVFIKSMTVVVGVNLFMNSMSRVLN
mmetsp:Transcript_8061/g.4266  ORF Transcript_8061/g.4266 Transcript_8061/m.4266 type:complete len:106 (+) Transcript_8061:74-391(+)